MRGRIEAGWEVSGCRGEAALTITDCTPLAKVHVRVPWNGAMAKTLGVPFGRAARDSGGLLIGSGPGEWLMLAPVVAAYEGEMCGADASRRATWREDRYSPCSRTVAGRYLAFLAGLGYPLAPIEQAVADGVPYIGDTPAGPDPVGSVATGGDPDGEAEADPGVARGGADATGIAQ